MRTPNHLRPLLASALLAACGPTERPIGVFPVGETVGDATEATIGASGGTLATPDGALTVTVPAGAVDADTTFSVQEITRTVPHGEGRAFRLEPHGATFAEPVSLTFAHDAAPSGMLLAGYQDDEGHWVPVIDSAYDAEAGTLTASTGHFSDWSVLEAYTLAAPSSTVRTGRSLDLEVKSCLYRDAWDEEAGLVLPALAATCEPFTLTSLIQAPSVDGKVGGDGTVGTVEKQGATLRYDAPAAVPPRGVVAVSAEIALLTRTKLLVVSHLRVVDDVAYSGTCSMSGEATGARVDATVTWTEQEDHGEVITYVPSGDVTYHLDDCTLSPATHAIAADDGYLEIDRSFTPPRYYGGGTTTWTATMDCGDGATVDMPVVAQWLTIPTPTAASADGRRLEGSEAYWTWSFVAPE